MNTKELAVWLNTQGALWPEEALVKSVYPCATSPTKTCVYVDVKFDAAGTCLFCERKHVVSREEWSAAAECIPDVICTWGEAEDITVSLKGTPLLLHEEPCGYRHSTHGYAFHGDLGLTSAQALKLAARLLEAVQVAHAAHAYAAGTDLVEIQNNEQIEPKDDA